MIPPSKSMFFYISKNKDWDYEKKNKYGVGDDLIRRKYDSHEQHSHLTEIVDAYEIKPRGGFTTRYNEVDKFVSIMTRDEDMILQEEKYCGHPLPLLREIRQFLVEHEGSTEFIYTNGLPLLHRVINEEFPLLGLDVIRRLSQEEINTINQERRIKRKTKQELERKRLRQRLREKYYTREKIQARPHQVEALRKAVEFFSQNDIGKLLWACGLGKTIFSLLLVKSLKSNKVLIGVPSIFLQNQFVREIKRVFPKNTGILCVGGDDKKSTKNASKIAKFMIKKKPLKIVVATYMSCKVLVDHGFDLKIGDEAHHLASIENDSSTFTEFHKIPANKTLFMTGTEKVIETDRNGVLSMDNEAIFGKCIDEKSVKWAIDNGLICDYYVVLLKEASSCLTERDELYRSAYSTLIALEKYSPNLSHVLTYTNSTESSDRFDAFITEILGEYPDKFQNVRGGLYHASIHSKSKNVFSPSSFEKSKFGIVSCVYMFGEGSDIPFLNGVVFAERMGSDIRIAQSALRPHRLNPDNPHKRAYIIVPYSETEKDKCITVVAKMRSVDESIEQRLSLDTTETPGWITHTDNQSGGSNNNMDIANELEHMKLMLRYSKALSSGLPALSDEYNHVRSINRRLNVQTSSDYKERFGIHNHEHYIDNPETYFEDAWNNWSHYLGSDTFCYTPTLEQWKETCIKHKITTPEDYHQKCKSIPLLPPEPHDFYKDFRNLCFELPMATRRRR